ncbi:hypothetical protein BDV12DRAFT_94961 [Aspergillus spectabilis]
MTILKVERSCPVFVHKLRRSPFPRLSFTFLPACRIQAALTFPLPTFPQHPAPARIFTVCADHCTQLSTQHPRP